MGLYSSEQDDIVSCLTTPERRAGVVVPQPSGTVKWARSTKICPNGTGLKRIVSIDTVPPLNANLGHIFQWASKPLSGEGEFGMRTLRQFFSNAAFTLRRRGPVSFL